MVLEIMTVWLCTSSPLYPLEGCGNSVRGLWNYTSINICNMAFELSEVRGEVQSKDRSQSELPRRFVESSVLYLVSEGTRKEGAMRQSFFVVPSYLQANVGRKPGNN
jgi:hypothetical protein